MAEPTRPDIYTEPTPSVDTLAHLGPLRPMAGIWQGARGRDVHPAVDGDHPDAYLEHHELQPIDAQTNGPQLFYGLRYHTHIVRPHLAETFHDQVGHWLWEPATGTVILTLSIPRGQVVLAMGKAAQDARQFTVEAVRGSTVNGILSNPFLEKAFRTDHFSMTVTVHDDGRWSYDETTTMTVLGRAEPVQHTDRIELTKVGEPTPNPTALAAAAAAAGDKG